jgi:adenylate cyclase
MMPMVIANGMGVLIFFYFLKNLIKEIASKRNEEKYFKEIQEKNIILEQMNAEITLQKDKEEKLRRIFQLYVPPQDLTSILDQDSLKPGGKIEYKTVLFSDIRGFTKMSEKLTPNDIVHFLNHYFEEMTKCIFNNKGIIDKFIGDAIMARFDNAEDAVKAAIEMINTLIVINKSEQKALFLKNIPDVKIGVGIANGEVIIGNIGGSTRMDFTVIGDIVNVASRLESATKMTEGKILITDYVYNNIDRTKFKIGNRKALKVRGKENALVVYEIFV